MRNLETATLKLGIFHPHDSLSQALIAAALQRQIEVSALQADLNSLQARPAALQASQPGVVDRGQPGGGRSRPAVRAVVRLRRRSLAADLRRADRWRPARRGTAPVSAWPLAMAGGAARRRRGATGCRARAQPHGQRPGLDAGGGPEPSRRPAHRRFQPRRRRRGSGGRQGVRLRRSAARRSPSRPASASACAWRPEEYPPCPDPIPQPGLRHPAAGPGLQRLHRFRSRLPPGRVSGAWYDLVLAFVAVWLAFWPEAGVLARSPSLANALGLVLQVGATLLGCLLGYGVARDCGGRCGKPGKRSASSPTSRRGS